MAREGLLDGEDAWSGAEEDALAALQAAEVDRRLRFPDPFKHSRRSAHLDGFSLHAGVRIHENDREGLERLVRYALRPPFALQRLSWGPEGRVVYRMKRPRGGSLFLVLTPAELLARIATLVPPPRSHALRYHGVFAPNSRCRSRVVPGRADSAQTDGVPSTPREVALPDSASPSPRQAPTHGPSAASLASPPARPSPPGSFRLEPPEPAPGRPASRTRVPWADLLRKVFALDVLECPKCAGRLEIIAYIAEAAVAKRILDHLGMDSQGPPLARARAPEDDAPTDPSPDYAGDPVYED